MEESINNKCADIEQKNSSPSIPSDNNTTTAVSVPLYLKSSDETEQDRLNTARKKLLALDQRDSTETSKPINFYLLDNTKKELLRQTELTCDNALILVSTEPSNRQWTTGTTADPPSDNTFFTLPNSRTFHQKEKINVLEENTFKYSGAGNTNTTVISSSDKEDVLILSSDDESTFPIKEYGKTSNSEKVPEKPVHETISNFTTSLTVCEKGKIPENDILENLASSAMSNIDGEQISSAVNIQESKDTAEIPFLETKEIEILEALKEQITEKNASPSEEFVPPLFQPRCWKVKDKQEIMKPSKMSENKKSDSLANPSFDIRTNEDANEIFKQSLKNILANVALISAENQSNVSGHDDFAPISQLGPAYNQNLHRISANIEHATNNQNSGCYSRNIENLCLKDGNQSKSHNIGYQGHPRFNSENFGYEGIFPNKTDVPRTPISSNCPPIPNPLFGSEGVPVNPYVRESITAFTGSNYPTTSSDLLSSVDLFSMQPINTPVPQFSPSDYLPNTPNYSYINPDSQITNKPFRSLKAAQWTACHPNEKSEMKKAGVPFKEKDYKYDKKYRIQEAKYKNYYNNYPDSYKNVHRSDRTRHNFRGKTPSHERDMRHKKSRHYDTDRSHCRVRRRSNNYQCGSDYYEKEHNERHNHQYHQGALSVGRSGLVEEKTERSRSRPPSDDRRNQNLNRNLVLVEPYLALDTNIDTYVQESTCINKQQRFQQPFEDRRRRAASMDRSHICINNSRRRAASMDRSHICINIQNSSTERYFRDNDSNHAQMKSSPLPQYNTMKTVATQSLDKKSELINNILEENKAYCKSFNDSYKKSKENIKNKTITDRENKPYCSQRSKKDRHENKSGYKAHKTIDTNGKQTTVESSGLDKKYEIPKLKRPSKIIYKKGAKNVKMKDIVKTEKIRDIKIKKSMSKHVTKMKKKDNDVFVSSDKPETCNVHTVRKAKKAIIYSDSDSETIEATKGHRSRSREKISEKDTVARVKKTNEAITYSSDSKCETIESTKEHRSRSREKISEKDTVARVKKTKMAITYSSDSDSETIEATKGHRSRSREKISEKDTVARVKKTKKAITYSSDSKCETIESTKEHRSRSREKISEKDTVARVKKTKKAITYSSDSKCETIESTKEHRSRSREKISEKDTVARVKKTKKAITYSSDSKCETIESTKGHRSRSREKISEKDTVARVKKTKKAITYSSDSKCETIESTKGHRSRSREKISAKDTVASVKKTKKAITYSSDSKCETIESTKEHRSRSREKISEKDTVARVKKTKMAITYSSDSNSETIEATKGHRSRSREKISEKDTVARVKKTKKAITYSSDSDSETPQLIIDLSKDPHKDSLFNSSFDVMDDSNKSTETSYQTIEPYTTARLSDGTKTLKNEDAIKLHNDDWQAQNIHKDVKSASNEQYDAGVKNKITEQCTQKGKFQMENVDLNNAGNKEEKDVTTGEKCADKVFRGNAMPDVLEQTCKKTNTLQQVDERLDSSRGPLKYVIKFSKGSWYGTNKADITDVSCKTSDGQGMLSSISKQNELDIGISPFHQKDKSPNKVIKYSSQVDDIPEQIYLARNLLKDVPRRVFIIFIHELCALRPKEEIEEIVNCLNSIVSNKEENEDVTVHANSNNKKRLSNFKRKVTSKKQKKIKFVSSKRRNELYQLVKQQQYWKKTYNFNTDTVNQRLRQRMRSRTMDDKLENQSDTQLESNSEKETHVAMKNKRCQPTEHKPPNTKISGEEADLVDTSSLLAPNCLHEPESNTLFDGLFKAVPNTEMENPKAELVQEANNEVMPLLSSIVQSEKASPKPEGCYEPKEYSKDNSTIDHAQQPDKQLLLPQNTELLKILLKSEQDGAQCNIFETVGTTRTTESLSKDELMLSAPAQASIGQALVEKEICKLERQRKCIYEEHQAWVLNAKHFSVFNSMLTEEKLVQIFKCAGRFCAYTTNSLDKAELHATTHQKATKIDKSVLMCAYCDFDCEGDTTDLVSHVFKMHGHCKYVCSQCFYRATASQLVVAHMHRVHESSSTILEVATPVCNFAEESLPRDIAIKSYVCANKDTSNPECQDSYFTQGSFVEHLRNHDPPYSCFICACSSNDPTELISHLSEHGFKQYHCTWCSDGADNEEDFLAHFSAWHPARQARAYTRNVTNFHEGKIQTMVLPVVELNRPSLETKVVTLIGKQNDLDEEYDVKFAIREADKAHNLEELITVASEEHQLHVGDTTAVSRVPDPPQILNQSLPTQIADHSNRWHSPFVANPITKNNQDTASDNIKSNEVFKRKLPKNFVSDNMQKRVRYDAPMPVLDVHYAKKSENPTVELHSFEGAEHCPKYVPGGQRYICGAKECVYTSLNEADLKCHWETFHEGSTDFKCAHCQFSVTCNPRTWTKIEEHINMHGNILYMCSLCNRYHYQYKVLEEHIINFHKNIGQVRTVRDQISTPVGDVTITTKSTMPWKCNCCRYCTNEKKKIVKHCRTSHGMQLEFKCTECEYTGRTTQDVRRHKSEYHGLNNGDVYYFYYYDDGTLLAEPDDRKKRKNIKQSQEAVQMHRPLLQPGMKIRRSDSLNVHQTVSHSVEAILGPSVGASRHATTVQTQKKPAQVTVRPSSELLNAHMLSNPYVSGSSVQATTSNQVPACPPGYLHYDAVYQERAPTFEEINRRKSLASVHGSSSVLQGNKYYANNLNGNMIWKCRYCSFSTLYQIDIYNHCRLHVGSNRPPDSFITNQHFQPKNLL